MKVSLNKQGFIALIVSVLVLGAGLYYLYTPRSATASLVQNPLGIEGYGYDNQPVPFSSEELAQLVPELHKKIAQPDLSKGYRKHPIRIDKRDGKYYWASNGDKPLVLTQKTIPLALDSLVRTPKKWVRNTSSEPLKVPEKPVAEATEQIFFVFMNTRGEGAIIVPYFKPVRLKYGRCSMSDTPDLWSDPLPPCVDWCQQRGGTNLVEFKRNNKGTFTPYVGRTYPHFPYPKSDICEPPLWQKMLK